MENKSNDVKRMEIEKDNLEKELEDLIIDRHDEMIEDLTMETVDKIFKDSSKVKRIYLKINKLVAVVTVLYGVIFVNVLFLLLGGLEIIVQKKVDQSLKEDYETVKKDYYNEVKNQVWVPNWELVEEFIEDRKEETKWNQYQQKITKIEKEIRVLESNIDVWKRIKTSDNIYRYRYEDEEEQEVVIENSLKK